MCKIKEVTNKSSYKEIALKNRRHTKKNNENELLVELTDRIIDRLATGEIFKVKDVMLDIWPDISKSSRSRLGRQFAKLVDSGNLNIVERYKFCNNHVKYRKKAELFVFKLKDEFK
jgi:hypothetical protein